MRSSAAGNGGSHRVGASGLSIAVDGSDNRGAQHGGSGFGNNDNKLISPKRGAASAPSPLASPGGTKSSLSMRLRADVASVEPRKAVSPSKHIENYSLPKLEQGWHKALRNGSSSNLSPPASPAKILQQTRSSPDLVATYERLSGLYEVGMRLGDFADRAHIQHPTNLCVKCSERASICVPCTEEMVHNGITTYIKARGKGAAYLFNNAIARAASSTVLRFVVFKIWKNAFCTRRRLIERGTRTAEMRLRTKAIALKDWQRYVKESAAEKTDRKAQTQDKRIQQLEEQLARLSQDHKALDNKLKATAEELRQERALTAALNAQVAQLQAEAQRTDRVILGLSGLCEPMLGLVSHLHGAASMVLEGMQPAAVVAPPKLLAPAAVVPEVEGEEDEGVNAYADVIAWANEASSDDCLCPDRCVSGQRVGDFLPNIAGPASDASELEDGRRFVRAVAALMLNSGVIPIDGEQQIEEDLGASSHEEEVPVEDSGGDCQTNAGFTVSDHEVGLGAAEVDGDVGPQEQQQVEQESTNEGGNETVAVMEEGGEVATAALTADAAVPSAECAQLRYTASDFVTFLFAAQDAESSPALLFELAMEHLGRFVGAPLSDLNVCLDKPGTSVALYRFVLLRLFSDEPDRIRARQQSPKLVVPCAEVRGQVDQACDPEAEAFVHVLNITRYRSKLAEVAEHPDGPAGWLDDMIRQERAAERRRARAAASRAEEGEDDVIHAHLSGSAASNATTDPIAGDGGGVDPNSSELQQEEEEQDAVITGAERLEFVRRKLNAELLAFVEEKSGGINASTTDNGAESDINVGTRADAFRSHIEAALGAALDRVRGLRRECLRDTRRSARDASYKLLDSAVVHAYVCSKAMQFAML